MPNPNMPGIPPQLLSALHEEQLKLLVEAGYVKLPPGALMAPDESPPPLPQITANFTPNHIAIIGESGRLSKKTCYFDPRFQQLTEPQQQLRQARRDLTLAALNTHGDNLDFAATAQLAPDSPDFAYILKGVLKWWSLSLHHHYKPLVLYKRITRMPFGRVEFMSNPQLRIITRVVEGPRKAS